VVAEAVFDAQSEVGESPVWDVERGGLWWVDLLRGELHYWDGLSASTRQTTIGQSLGFVVPFQSGHRFVAGTRDGIGVIDEDGHFSLIVPVERDRPDFRMNDGKCDPHGRLWAGTMNDLTHRDGRLYCMTGDWHVSTIFEGLRVPNGIGWTKDGRLMYFADTGIPRLELWDFDPVNGRPIQCAHVVTFGPDEGGPDGLTVDAEGCAWVCMWGGHSVRRYSPTGEWLQTIDIPAKNVASCVFGGQDFQDLYITTARYGLSPEELHVWPLSGCVFRCCPGVRGVPADAFKG
jgi:sugar lactone lactonase YvrE